MENTVDELIKNQIPLRAGIYLKHDDGIKYHTTREISGKVHWYTENHVRAPISLEIKLTEKYNNQQLEKMKKKIMNPSKILREYCKV